MFDFDPLYAHLTGSALEPWVDELPQQLEQIFNTQRPHGKLAEWLQVLAELPALSPGRVELNADRITVGSAADVSPEQAAELERLLKLLHPWRKGPYELFGVHVDTEWRSDFKWQRIAPHLSSLKDRRVLDVGCGNGYHMWRMLGEGARLCIGADPSQFFLCQLQAVKHYAGMDQPIHILPFKSEELPPFRNMFAGGGFDTVFSMGVLYHRASPVAHLQELRRFLKPDGELVLETLVIEGDERQVLVPEDRYAKMRNVWFLPSTGLLQRLLERVGFKEVRVADVSPTTGEEQRSTDWMTFESLPDFLDPDNPQRTIEGYPAPLRATIIAVA